ncbi:type II toxin-antitoxin system VapC family toxin [Aliiglaciecola sp. CAU 1673]|uniref:type II toxin-antitoxin system VapC family toxin n=1 Tax=Aliiglaciecola sp. CAU 1673 TaxID=3032595 RepID=UPI0023DC65E6|nr:type II toxin-antitoxin system VapC family toxin [Aliiglaciecola sp. CAU 1673]MDF2176871.1 type II toxin-antitoxin system VapC family toxin [Aliiglaciecola sp. CAU 1673]
MFLLDTNVVSELRKARSKSANPAVVAWASRQAIPSLFISAITVMEIEMGILQKARKDARQAAVLRTWFESHVLTAFSGRILPVDTSVALQCAKLHIPNPKSERDAMIAATALVHGLTLVTRNLQDFQHIEVRVLDPWG